MFDEDLNVFFNAGEFGVPANWTPSQGGARQDATVILDAPDLTVLGDIAVTRHYEMFYPAGTFPDLGYGDRVTVNSVLYEVMDVLAIDDGAINKARLSRV